MNKSATEKAPSLRGNISSMEKMPLTSHQLAQTLLGLPNLPISCHEHGELLVGVEVDQVAANVGLLKCIVLQFE